MTFGVFLATHQQVYYKTQNCTPLGLKRAEVLDRKATTPDVVFTQANRRCSRMDLLPAHQFPVLSDPGFPFPNDCLPVNGVEIAGEVLGFGGDGGTSPFTRTAFSGFCRAATNSRAPRPSANSSCSIRDRHSRAISAASSCRGTRRVIHETRSRTDADDAGEMFGPYLGA